MRSTAEEAFERLAIWQDSDLRDRLTWYRQVAANRKPAKFRIACHVPVDVSLAEAGEEALWEALEAATPAFLELWGRIRRGEGSLPAGPAPRPNLLELCRELTQRMLRHCTFCRWQCGVDRSAGAKLGTCKLAEESRVSSYFHHRGEELIYRGRQGSGTIFFTSCNMRCAFCLHPDSFVLTTRGPIRIAQLYAEGGAERQLNGGWARSAETLRVFSFDGRPVKVKQLFRHDYSGDLIRIEPLYGPPITVTPEHQILSSKHPDDPLVKTPAAQLSSGDWLTIPRPAFADSETGSLDVASIVAPLAADSTFITTANRQLPKIRQAVAMAQAGASSVQVAARLGYHPAYVRFLMSRIRRVGLPQTPRPNVLVLEDGRVRLATEKRPGIPAHLKIDERLAEFLGYYGAEGHISHGRNRPSSYRIVLSFGRHETELVERAAALAVELFGMDPGIVERRTTITVELGKSSLALLIGALCGHSSRTKRVPEFLFEAPAPVVEAYLRAFLAGDGCTTGPHLSFNTVSETLAMGLFALLLRLGHLPSFNVYTPPAEKSIEGRTVKQNTFYYVKMNEARMREGSWATARHVRYRFRDHHILVPIHRVTRVSYSGPVYNLEVDDDQHTYTANFIAVGNCQNGDISTDRSNGRPVSPRTLATMAWLLRSEGCHNINWVGGEVTIHLHTIVAAIAELADLQPTALDIWEALPVKADGFLDLAALGDRALHRGAFNAPMLWNSNFFMSEPALRILRLLMDVWLPDLKFGPGPCAVALSRTPWYWETVTGNLVRIHAWGEEFTIRHLVMPGHVECCTRPVLEWIAATMPEVPVNVMDQYHPDNVCDPRSERFNPKYAAMARRPTGEEIRQAFRYARELGLRFQALSYERNTTGIRL